MTITRQCLECDGFGELWHPRRGGLDPDGRVIECDNCEGTGDEEIGCISCDEPATEMLNGHPWCAACLADQKVDVLPTAQREAA